MYGILLSKSFEQEGDIMKKILFFATMLLMLSMFLVGCEIGTIPETTTTSTSAEEITPPIEGIVYEASADGTYAIVVGYEGTDTHIVIEATYNDLPVLVIGNGAFASKTFTSVVIPDSVTTIGEDAFAACESLTDVNYIGSVEQWAQISIDSGNDVLASVTMHYNYGQNSSGTELPDDHPFD